MAREQTLIRFGTGTVRMPERGRGRNRGGKRPAPRKSRYGAWRAICTSPTGN